MKKPTSQQLAALIRIRDFVGFAAQFPKGCNARMRDTLVQQGWAKLTFENSAGVYTITEAGRAHVSTEKPGYDTRAACEAAHPGVVCIWFTMSALLGKGHGHERRWVPTKTPKL